MHCKPEAQCIFSVVGSIMPIKAVAEVKFLVSFFFIKIVLVNIYHKLLCYHITNCRRLANDNINFM